MSNLVPHGITAKGLNLPEKTKARKKRVKGNDEENIFKIV